MKHFSVLILNLFIATAAFAQHGETQNNNGEHEDHHAMFAQRSWSFGLAVPYSYGIQGYGLNTRIYYNIGHSICFGPEVAVLYAMDNQVWDFDFVAHYVVDIKIAGVYPLAGVNYTSETFESHNIQGFGVVFGGGLHRNIKRFTLFTETSFVFGKIDDHLVTTGIFYTIH